MVSVTGSLDAQEEVRSSAARLDCDAALGNHLSPVPECSRRQQVYPVLASW
jgi:hypothetical protein